MRGIKADYDSRMSYYNIAVEHKDPEAQKHLDAANAFLKQLNEERPKLEKLDAEVAEANNEPLPVGGDTKISLAQAQKDLKELEASHKKLTGDFDRFIKLAMQKQWTWRDSLRSMPILDGFAAPIKIKQTFHEDLPIDYGGFKYVTRYDRCATCHLGIDKPGLDNATLSRLAVDPSKDEELKQQTANAQALLLERQKANPNGKTDISVLADRDLVPNQVAKLTPERIKSFAAHPRLDLFVDANSPHAADKFGCTICHQGQGSATSFFDADHTPNNAAIKEKWEKEHHWHQVHTGDWEFPMLPPRFIEASCVKCHHQIEDMVRDGTKVEAEKLMKGYHLVKDLGCFGCHEISGSKSGRAVGPDMRLEPEPPLDALSPAERVKRLADTANPPGTLRKVGPSLTRVAEKTNPEWAMKWIKAPRAFKPDTKMPHFYLQANNVDEALPPDQKKFPDAEIRAVTHYLFAQSQKHIAANKAESVTLPNAPADDAGKKAQQDIGRNLFATKGCMACHQHKAMETAGQTVKGEPAPALVGESYFGPELSGVAGKVTDKKWLVQWLLDPTKHSPRTLMPNVHLTTAEADDIASWLLAQPADATPEWATLAVEPAERETLAEMARAYLRKAGKTSREVEAGVTKGYTPEEVKYFAADSDERELTEPVDDNKLLFYIGKKAINNLGCYACHTIPGFESAKPIGVNLNDWGKKDVDRIAYEDAENYVAERYHTVLLRDDPADKAKPDKDWKPGDGKLLPLEKFAPYTTAKQPPYEKFFVDMLSHSHRMREGFLHLKLMSPRAYDYNRVRDWNDRARMPQFKFSRIKRLPDESDEAFQIRRDRDEAEGREAAMTFILGLIAEPIPPKYLPDYSPERMAEIRGRKVIEKFNCSSCHLIRPGIYDMLLSNDIVHDAEGKTVMVDVTDKDGKTKSVPLTQRKAILDRLNLAHMAFTGAEQGDPKDRPYPEHNAWATALQSTDKPTDKITVHGVLGISFNDTEGNIGPSLRPTRAVTYKDADGSMKTIPANPSFGIPYLPQAMSQRGAPYNGIFALQLKRYLSELDPKVYGDVQPLMRYDDEGGKGPDGYAAIPPALIHEGERVQPGWLYQFLLNPYKVRKIPPLMMPKFSMSDEEASDLVNYFASANKLENPGVGLGTFAKFPQRDEAYLLQKTKEYVATLKENKLLDSRVNEMKPLWARVAREQMASAERRAAEFRAVKEDAKAAEAAKEVERWRSQIAANDFPTLRATWEEREAYLGDAWKLVTYTGNLCITCHQVGPALPSEYRAPNLDLAWERLRPEWTMRWIAYPQRLNPYASLMQPQYKPGEAKKHFEDAKVFIGGPDEQIRASRDLLIMYPMVADWPIIKYRIGPTAFGQPTTPATPPAR